MPPRFTNIMRSTCSGEQLRGSTMVKLMLRVTYAGLLIALTIAPSFNQKLSQLKPSTRSVQGPYIALAWDRNPDPNIAGYMLYWGTASRNYNNSFSAGQSLQHVVTGVQPYTNYYFAVTDYDTNGIQSDYSPEIVGRAVPITNVVTFTTHLMGSPNVIGSYTDIVVTSFSVTNAVGIDFIKSQTTVSITNIAK